MKTRILPSVLGLLMLGGPVAAEAHQAGDWLVRAGAIVVDPDDSSGKVFVDGLGRTDMEVSVDNDTQVGLNFAYMFTDNWAVEVLAATPFTHDIDLERSQLGLGNGKLAEVSQLPPTVSVLYFFGSATSDLRPYVGLGINYTFFFDEDFSGSRKAQGFSDLDLDDSWGVAVEAGLDYNINEHWFVNGQLRYINIDTDADFKVGTADSSVSVDIDPWVYMIGLGYRF